MRAANIPARYAYGTVEIPAEKVMNWVGGAHNPEAAQGILGMGGVPVIGMLEGGKIANFKLEHVWVEAWVDYVPSRGMVEKVGDSWIPMDASFKQYDFTAGMNLQEQVPFDADALLSTIQTNAIVNEDEGWVQNVPQAAIEQQLEDFQAQLQTYIENQNPDATVGDVLGLQEITILPPRPLAAGLPYHRIITSQTFAEVPNNLRHKFKYSLATQSAGYAGNTLITIEEPTVKLAGKTLALSFKPATQADEDIIQSRLPAPEADGSIDPTKLPSTLPGYLINLTAEFTIDGHVIKSGAAGTLGGELYETMGLWSPKEGWETSVNYPTAGSYRAIGLNLQGANPEQAARLRQQLEQTKTKLESAGELELATLTKHNLVGDLLYGTLFNYFALNDLQDRIAAQSSNMLNYRLPSYGTFSTNLQTQYWFGLPRNVTFGGLSMDIDHMKQHRIAKNNNMQESREFSESIGARMSAMEHQVPEEIFSSNTGKAEGVSAVKAISIAASQGQKVWTIDQSNLNLALSRIDLGADAENDIRNAVNAGKVATTHETRINFNGWIGEGYILMDQNTGAGAYMISGGRNGGETQVPHDAPIGLNMVSVLSPALAFTKASSSTKQATATFFGVVKCKLGEVVVGFAIVIALIVAALMFKRLILASIAIPELGKVGVLISGLVISALSMAGVENAEEAADRDCMIGDCTVREHRELEDKKDEACSQSFSCNAGMSDSLLAINSLKALACAGARKDIMDRCYKGGDDGHKQAYEEAMRSHENCLEILSGR